MILVIDSLLHFSRFFGDSKEGGAEEARLLFRYEDLCRNLPRRITKPRNVLLAHIEHTYNSKLLKNIYGYKFFVVKDRLVATV